MTDEGGTLDRARPHAGRVAIVTGAGRGIGRAVALELARGGAAVVVNDVGASLEGTGRSSEIASAVVDEINEKGGRAVAHAGSVADQSSVEELIRMALDDLGGLDILVNVAGIMRKGSIFDASREDWNKVLEVHLTGSFTTCRAAAPIMAKRGWGRIVNFTSHSAFGFEGQPAYAAAKAGIIGLTMAAATELAESGVTCNAIAPAASTRMSESSRPEFERMRREGVIDEAVWERFESLPPPTSTSPVVSYLVSDAAADITGLVFTAGFGVSAIKVADETTMHTKERAGQPFSPEELHHIIPAVAREAREGNGLLAELPDQS